jgi:hypothetical protein
VDTFLGGGDVQHPVPPNQTDALPLSRQEELHKLHAASSLRNDLPEENDVTSLLV